MLKNCDKFVEKLQIVNLHYFDTNISGTFVTYELRFLTILQRFALNNGVVVGEVNMHIWNFIKQWEQIDWLFF